MLFYGIMCILMYVTTALFLIVVELAPSGIQIQIKFNNALEQEE